MRCELIISRTELEEYWWVEEAEAKGEEKKKVFYIEVIVGKNNTVSS